MKLLFDISATQPNRSGKRHGGGRYGEIIFLRMIERGIDFSCFYNSNMWLNPEIKNVIDQRNIPLYDLANQKLQEIVSHENFERVYSCIPSIEVLHLNNCEIYGTLHGLRDFETPFDKCFWDYKNNKKDIAKFLIGRVAPRFWHAQKAKQYREKFFKTNAKIIMVSEHSKYALLSFFPETKDMDIRVFYSPNTSLDNIQINHTLQSEPYFLVVSGNRWEKNNARAIKAFDRLIDCDLLDGVRMKVTGAKRENFKFDIKHLEAFDFLGYVTDQELEQLYANAYLFVYPSLNEGFGYPPIEAMRYHIPVIASPLSSIADICDSGALYFDPFSIEEIMNRMMMMMEPSKHEEFAQRGYNQYLKISERQKRDLDGLIDYITN